ncbi:MAG TPA: hypothetical protein VMW17_16600, partial [Candidatus Binatia bacterium]|nr:hypothetical protein [Candidatus Binatia bacterium]
MIGVLTIMLRSPWAATGAVFAITLLVLILVTLIRTHSQSTTFEIDAYPGTQPTPAEAELREYGEGDIWSFTAAFFLRIYNLGNAKISLPGSSLAGRTSPGVGAAIVERRRLRGLPKRVIPEPIVPSIGLPTAGFAALTDTEDSTTIIPSVVVDAGGHTKSLRWTCLIHFSGDLMRALGPRHQLRVIVRPVGETAIYQDVLIDWAAVREARSLAEKELLRGRASPGETSPPTPPTPSAAATEVVSAMNGRGEVWIMECRFVARPAVCIPDEAFGGYLTFECLNWFVSDTDHSLRSIYLDAVSELCTIGLLRDDSDPTSRTGKYYSLTQSGWKFFRGIAQADQDKLQATARPLTAEEEACLWEIKLCHSSSS